MLLFSKRKKEEDEPQLFDTNKTEVVVRPDGTHINVEYYGNEGGTAHHLCIWMECQQ